MGIVDNAGACDFCCIRLQSRIQHRLEAFYFSHDSFFDRTIAVVVNQ